MWAGKRKLNSGQTLFELIWLLSAVALGVFLAVRLGKAIGAIGYIVGLPLGLSIVFGGIMAINRYVEWWIPVMPACTCGKCNYDFIVKREDGNLSCEHRCLECNRLYVKKSRSVFEVMSDGSERLHADHRRFGRWKPN